MRDIHDCRYDEPITVADIATAKEEVKVEYKCTKKKRVTPAGTLGF